jgi:hypothetical protein
MRAAGRRTVPPLDACGAASSTLPDLLRRVGLERPRPDAVGEGPAGVAAPVVPDVGHHVGIGQPVALIAVLRLLLHRW